MLRIGFFLILWFVVGISLIPMFLRSVRKLISEETLLVVSLGLCCLMAVISTQVGFSSAFGAFVMGSILAETVEAEKIIKVVEPVKNKSRAMMYGARKQLGHRQNSLYGDNSIISCLKRMASARRGFSGRFGAKIR